ncbi:MAG TPA: matrixin family metalloprotease [Ktedonobacterales bacterium]|jgi:predicted Zn-dependent protease
MATEETISYKARKEGSMHRHSRLCGNLLTAVGMIAVLLGYAFMAPSTNAYATEGIRWVDNWHIYYTMKPMQSYDSQAWTDGVWAWNNSAAPVFFYGGGSQIIMFDANDGANGYSGWTTWGVNTFNCTYPSGYNQLKVANVKLNYYYTQSYSPTARKGVAAHELGHALGLAHASLTSSLMYYASTATVPQSDDINGVNYIYAHSCN